MKTLSDLLAEVDADIEKEIKDWLEGKTPFDELHEIAGNNVPNSDREVIEVFYSEHSLGDATDQSYDSRSVLEWLRANIEKKLKDYAEEEFERQKEEYEDMVRGFEKEGYKCRALTVNYSYYILKPEHKMLPTLHESVQFFLTEYEAWKALEKEKE